MGAAQVGLKDLYYALLTKDDGTGVAYSAPVKVPGLMNAKVETKTSSEILYADDGAAESATTVGETSVEIELKDIPLATQAAWLGHTLTAGVLEKSVDDAAPYLALGFKSVKSNGKYRFIWLLKGKFEIPNNDYATKQDKVAFQTPKIKASFLKRENDNLYMKIADEDETGFVETTGTNWFTETTINVPTT